MENLLPEAMFGFTNVDVLQAVLLVIIAMLMISIIGTTEYFKRQLTFADLASEQEITKLRQKIIFLLGDQIDLNNEVADLHEDILNRQKRENNEKKKYDEIVGQITENVYERHILQKIVGWCLQKISTQEESMKDVQESLIENEVINKELKCNLGKMGQKLKQAQESSLTETRYLEDIISLQNKLIEDLKEALCEEIDRKELALKLSQEAEKKVTEHKNKVKDAQLRLSVVQDLAKDTSNSLKSLLLGEKESRLKCEKINKELTEKLEKAEKDVETYRRMYKELQIDMEKSEKHWRQKLSNIEERAHENWLLFRQEKKKVDMLRNQCSFGPIYMWPHHQAPWFFQNQHPEHPPPKPKGDPAPKTELRTAVNDDSLEASLEKVKHTGIPGNRSRLSPVAAPESKNRAESDNSVPSRDTSHPPQGNSSPAGAVRSEASIPASQNSLPPPIQDGQTVLSFHLPPPTSSHASSRTVTPIRESGRVTPVHLPPETPTPVRSRIPTPTQDSCCAPPGHLLPEHSVPTKDRILPKPRNSYPAPPAHLLPGIFTHVRSPLPTPSKTSNPTHPGNFPRKNVRSSTLTQTRDRFPKPPVHLLPENSAPAEYRTQTADNRERDYTDNKITSTPAGKPLLVPFLSSECMV